MTETEKTQGDEMVQSPDLNLIKMLWWDLRDVHKQNAKRQQGTEKKNVVKEWTKNPSK